MVNQVTNQNQDAAQFTAIGSAKPLIPRDLTVEKQHDSVVLGKGKPATVDQALNMVAERSFEKLQAVVEEARAALGMAEGVEVDTSAEATGNRIADFALGFFSQYAENNGLEDTEEGRQQYADFIGKAIDQGVSEARDILTALNSLNPEIDENITQTSDVISQRLENFVANGL